MEATTTPTHQVEAISIEVAMELGADSVPNFYGGYDHDTTNEFGDTVVLRIAQDDPQGGVEVYTLNAHQVCLTTARFSAGVNVEAIVAYSTAIVK